MGRLDTTQPGGRYIVRGKLVDANGKPVTEEAEPMVPAPPAPGGDGLPEGFPARDELAAAGFATLDAVKAASDEQLDAVPGIGPATLKEIRAASK